MTQLPCSQLQKFRNDSIAYQWESQRTNHGILTRWNTRQQSKLTAVIHSYWLHISNMMFHGKVQSYIEQHHTHFPKLKTSK